MKKLKYFIILTVAISAMASSCGKDGATGPAGPAGTTGPQGATGATGPAGANGSVIYSGTTVPSSTTGAIGDYYLNTTTSLFYGPKTSGGWGTGFSLKGATGAAGAAGSKIYSGSTAPASTLGAIGDYYLNTSNYMFYGPKASTGWNVPISLQGPQGNANVQTTAFSLTSSQWLWNSGYVFQTTPSSYTEYFTRYADNTVSTITQDILDNGEVMVYVNSSPTTNTNQWVPLPFQYTDGSGNFNYEMAYETNVGTVRLHYFFVQLVASATIPTLSTFTIATYKFKVVVISGKLVSALKKNNVNMKDYYAVSKFTGLWQNDKDQ